MKSIVKQNNTDNSQLIGYRKDQEIKLMDVEKTKHGYFLQIKINKLEKDNYRLFVKGKYLTILLVELKEVSRPIHFHNLKLHNFEDTYYEVIKSYDLWLPGDNFYLVRHFYVPADQILHVFLGRFHRN